MQELDEGVRAIAVQWFQHHFREYFVEEIHWLVSIMVCLLCVHMDYV
jgi:CRISPR/Cas system-associated protein Cas7 (RAMP superfamily)